jgi:hypothetical protein
MPQKGLSMRKIREVLRLRYDLGLLQHEIARSLLPLPRRKASPQQHPACSSASLP